jgi:hypothetical protein
MIMKRLLSRLMPVLLLVVVISACMGPGRLVVGSGDVIEEPRQVSGVSGVNLATVGDLTIELGDTESFSITADDNLMQYLKTSVVGDVLRIEGTARVNLKPSTTIKYSLTVKSLDSIKVTSVGDVNAPALTADRFTVTISSTGDVNIPSLEAESLKVDISSTGNLSIDEGSVKSQDIKISSTGKYNAQDLASEDANVRLSSTGSATIWVENSLTAKLSSTGDLYYRGNPAVDSTTNSTGDVIHLGD